MDDFADVYPADMPEGGGDILADEPQQQDQSQSQQDAGNEPPPQTITIEEIAQRRKHITYLAIAKSDPDFTDLYNSLGVSDQVIASYSLEQLELLVEEYKKLRGFKSSYTMFLGLAERASFMYESLLVSMGLDVIGVHDRLSADTQYKKALKMVVHDYAPAREVSPLVQLCASIIYATTETYQANCAKKKLGELTVDEASLDAIAL